MSADYQHRSLPHEHCECGHALQRHEVPGFDGECVSDGCRCAKYRPRSTTVDLTPPATAPVTAPAPAKPAPPAVVQAARPGGPTAEQIIAAGKRSTSKRTSGLAVRIEAHLTDLTQRVRDERKGAEERREKTARQEAARAEVERLSAELKAARAKLSSPPTAHPPTFGEYPCPTDGCTKVATTPQGLGAHRRHHGYRRAG